MRCKAGSCDREVVVAVQLRNYIDSGRQIVDVAARKRTTARIGQQGLDVQTRDMVHLIKERLHRRRLGSKAASFRAARASEEGVRSRCMGASSKSEVRERRLVDTVGQCERPRPALTEQRSTSTQRRSHSRELRVVPAALKQIVRVTMPGTARLPEEKKF